MQKILAALELPSSLRLSAALTAQNLTLDMCSFTDWLPIEGEIVSHLLKWIVKIKN